VDLADLAGSGTAADPYIITNAHELNAVRQDLAASYRLGNDIDLKDTIIWHYGQGWLPLGSSTSGSPFTGTFDGGGFTISGLTINRPATGYQGLFGYTHGAVLQNIRLAGMQLQAGSYSGGLAGYTNGGFVENVSVSARMISTGDYIGGLVGYHNGGQIRHSYSTGAVQGGQYVGGLVGYIK
jgi:hypothetical protein